MRAVKFAGAAVAAIIIVIAVLLVVGIPSGFLTSTIASRVESATGYRLSIDGTTRISLWPTLNVTLNDLTLQDPKDRPSHGLRDYSHDCLQCLPQWVRSFMRQRVSI